MFRPSKISKAAFHDEAAAFEYLEATIWPDGPICPHCGSVGNATRLQTAPAKPGKRAARIGLWKCKEKECRKQFRVTVGTVFEHGRIPLHKMLQAVYLLCCSKKGISSHQLHRVLGITYRAAWFLSHRIREAMRPDSMTPMGGAGQVVEIDETAQGRVEGAPRRAARRMGSFGNTVFALVQRHGEARSFHIEGTTLAELLPIIHANVGKETAIMTDAASWYKYLNKDGKFARHDRVDHGAEEYVRYEGANAAFRSVVFHCSVQQQLVVHLADGIVDTPRPRMNILSKRRKAQMQMYLSFSHQPDQVIHIIASNIEVYIPSALPFDSTFRTSGFTERSKFFDCFGYSGFANSETAYPHKIFTDERCFIAKVV